MAVLYYTAPHKLSTDIIKRPMIFQKYVTYLHRLVGAFAACLFKYQNLITGSLDSFSKEYCCQNKTTLGCQKRNCTNLYSKRLNIFFLKSQNACLNSNRGRHCLSKPFWQATGVRNFRTFIICCMTKDVDPLPVLRHM